MFSANARGLPPPPKEQDVVLDDPMEKRFMNPAALGVYAPATRERTGDVLINQGPDEPVVPRIKVPSLVPEKRGIMSFLGTPDAEGDTVKINPRKKK
jgi:hypothetical protein